MLEIFGVPFSAHTRKVLLTLREKAIPFELVPVIPLNPPPGWTELSPLGKIPVLRTPDISVPDSSVICQYIERTHPEPAVYPSDPVALAKALWIEELVDGNLATHVLRGLLMERVFAPIFLKRAPDEAVIRNTLERELPPRLAYLERELSGDDTFYAEGFSIADITLASILINYHFAGERLHGYPRLERYLHKVLRRPAFRQAFAVELPAAEQIEGLDLSILRDALR